MDLTKAFDAVDLVLELLQIQLLHLDPHSMRHIYVFWLCENNLGYLGFVACSVESCHQLVIKIQLYSK